MTKKTPKLQMNKIRGEKGDTIDCKNTGLLGSTLKVCIKKLDKFLNTHDLPKLHYKDKNSLNIAIEIKAE